MAKRRGQTTSRKRAGGRSTPGWLWGVAGLSVGLFVALLVHLHHTADNPPDLAGLLAPKDKPADGPSGTAESGEAGREKPRFEFYRLLPEQEVDVPEPEVAEPAAEPERTTPDAPAATPADAKSYLLQAGSFQGFDDADRMKANLALLGIEANIQKVQLSGGETWHRVRIGPYTDQAALNAIRRRLQENGVETIILQRDG